jgi:hypothetical protein
LVITKSKRIELVDERTCFCVELLVDKKESVEGCWVELAPTLAVFASRDEERKACRQDELEDHDTDFEGNGGQRRLGTWAWSRGIHHDISRRLSGRRTIDADRRFEIGGWLKEVLTLLEKLQKDQGSKTKQASNQSE